MKRYIILLLCFIYTNAFTQNEYKSLPSNTGGGSDSLFVKKDSLYSKRKLFTTQIYSQGLKKTKKEIKIIFSHSPKAKTAYDLSRTLLPIAALSSIVGGGLIYNSIDGIPESTTINNQLYDYRVRSFPKLLIGIGLITISACILEYSNELVRTSIDIYKSQNKLISHKSRIEQRITIGVTPNGGIGLLAQF